MPDIYNHELIVGPNSIDLNDHASNIEFVRWMQDAAMAHADVRGCTAATLKAGATWVVRAHRIDYRRPALLGDNIIVRTWVANLRRSFSLRKYLFVRPTDKTVLARGQTDWVYIDEKTGRPKTVPENIERMFEVLTEADEPKE